MQMPYKLEAMQELFRRRAEERPEEPVVKKKRAVRFRCRDCGGIFERDQIRKIGNLPFCVSCAPNHVLCSHCNSMIKLTTEKYYRNRSLIYCEDCIPKMTFICPICGELKPTFHSIVDRNRVRVCRDCTSSTVVMCDDCGAWCNRNVAVRNTAGIFCPTCLPNNNFRPEDDRIGSMPSLNFKHMPGEHTYKYIGVELEVDGGDFRKTVRRLNHSFHDDIFLKYDGSLSDRGIEIVTHPCTFRYHMEELPWEEIIRVCRQGKYTSHKNQRCGLHLHVSRRAFGEDSTYQANMARLLYLVDIVWPQLSKFTRRSPSSLDRWASHYGNGVDRRRYDCDIAYYNAVRSYTCNSRYRSVNMSPRNTIEFRLFRGTLKHQTLVGTIQMVNLLCSLAVEKKNKEIMEMSWPKLKEEAQNYGYEELLGYCEKRGL